MAKPPSSPSDEDAFVAPVAWRRKIDPRRGGHWLPAKASRIKADTHAWLTRRTAESMEKLRTTLLADSIDSHRRNEIDRHLNGTATPTGAAAVLEWELFAGYHSEPRDCYVADVWASDHGLAFAAAAIAELTTLTVAGTTASTAAATHELALRSGQTPYYWRGDSVARRLRRLLIHASDRDYAAVIDTLSTRRTTAFQRSVVAYLVPDQVAWVDEECRQAANTQGRRETLLLHSMSTIDQLTCLDDDRGLLDRLGDQGILATIADGIGPALAPVLAEILDQENQRGIYSRIPDAACDQILEFFGFACTDQAFDLLVAALDGTQSERTLITACRRQPRRALRRLAKAAATAPRSAKHTKAVVRVLRAQLGVDPAVTTEIAPTLAAPERELIGKLTADSTPNTATPTLPEILVRPPWSESRKAIKPVVIADLTPLANRTIIVDAADQAGENCFVPTPEMLTSDADPAAWDSEVSLVLENAPYGAPEMLLPFGDVRVAERVASWLQGSAELRATAREWLRRHAITAPAMLIPAALRRQSVRRREAMAALRRLAADGGTDRVIEAARKHGPEAAAAIEAELAMDPLDVMPVKVPKIGTWAEPGLLPPLLSRDGALPLPDSAVRHVITIFALSRTDEFHAGLDVVCEACESDSLADFAVALFAAWRAADMPNEPWLLPVLSRLGGDKAVRALVPFVSGSARGLQLTRMIEGVHTLGSLGTDLALLHLHTLAGSAKRWRIRDEARLLTEQIAEQRGSSFRELGDRVVPDLGLDAQGGLLLDYGPRRFRIDLDEALRPRVSDADGKPRRSLPKPGSTDDPRLAPSAHQRFTELCADVKAVLAAKTRLFKDAMETHRRWSVAEFHQHFVAQPLVWPVARALVWTVESGGTIARSFRLAEDRTPADLADETCPLPDGARIGIAHPARLHNELTQWAPVFADYEIVQPFPQIGAIVPPLTAEESAETRLSRFEGSTVPTRSLSTLWRRGWCRAEEGVVTMFHRPLAEGRRVEVWLNPGYTPGISENAKEQILQEVRLVDAGTPLSEDSGKAAQAVIPFSALGEVDRHEIVYDLTQLSR